MSAEIRENEDRIKVIFQRNYPGYLYRRELWQFGTTPDSQTERVTCYSSDTGDYIGPPSLARWLCKRRGLRRISSGDSDSGVACIGFNEKELKWYGWSHRAIVAFGIGDKLFEEKFGNEHTPYVEHGHVTIKTMGQAKQAAINLAEYVS